MPTHALHAFNRRISTDGDPRGDRPKCSTAHSLGEAFAQPSQVPGRSDAAFAIEEAPSASPRAALSDLDATDSDTGMASSQATIQTAVALARDLHAAEDASDAHAVVQHALAAAAAATDDDDGRSKWADALRALAADCSSRTRSAHRYEIQSEANTRSTVVQPREQPGTYCGNRRGFRKARRSGRLASPVRRKLSTHPWISTRSIGHATHRVG